MTKSDPTLKIQALDAFYGDCKDLKRFLLQCDIYFRLKDDNFDDEEHKVLFLVSLLKGLAAEWMEPHARDFLDNTRTQRKTATSIMFEKYEAACQAMQQMFGVLGEERRAELQIRQLHQGGQTVLKYTATFQRLLAKVNWDEKAAVSQFYVGLKDSVKDTMALRSEERPGTVEELSSLAKTINARKNVQELERKGQPYRPGGGNHQGRKQFHGGHKQQK